ncbi:uncharacterized protein LOC133313494 [Gastrolobium bilobum]|uniref:uncharacterized protein LOC133313494 n=1 Tax=Gastrolobium bilobum TaxID=150636 RepID=UPI002AB2CA5B|nr:uncharacterized protein LOC133313494 [Gastrolobium bilobum]
MMLCTQVNTRFISKALILPLSILVLLSSTTYSFQEKTWLNIESPKGHNGVKSATFVSKKFEMGPGSILAEGFFDIEFPKGHVGIKSVDAELIDEEGNSVPLYDTYLHHFFIIRYFENITLSKNPKARQSKLEGFIFKRNEGPCYDYVLPFYWGMGGESRKTSSNIPDPFAVEIGNPAEIPDGYEEKWLLNIMAIDTRGALDREGCSECRCDLFNLPKDFYNVTRGTYGEPLTKDYKGGMFCCQDKFQCKLREGFQGPRRNLSLRYKIRWVDWDQHQIPVKIYVLDSTDQVRSNGSKVVHECQKANIPMQKGGYLIYASGHMHSGAINATLYGQDGRTLCTSKPKYGKGKKAGDEKGYAVGMSVCYPKPGSIKIKDGETLTFESRYKSGFRTGVMGQFNIYLAERLPLSTKTS